VIPPIGSYTPAPMLTPADFRVRWIGIRHLAHAPELHAFVDTLINAYLAAERREAHTWRMYVQACARVEGVGELPPGSPFPRGG